MPFEFGDVVLVAFPFTHQAASKKRPAVVISGRTYNSAKPDVVIMAITSQLRTTPEVGEAWIVRWREAGLLKPSAVKPVVATIEQRMVQRRLGSWSPRIRRGCGLRLPRSWGESKGRVPRAKLLSGSEQGGAIADSGRRAVNP